MNNTYTTKLYTNKIKVSIEDDIKKAAEFLNQKVKETAKIDITFTFDVEETPIRLSDVREKLVEPLIGKYDVVGYVFDRYDQNTHMSLSYGGMPKETQMMTIMTSTEDDKVGGTWMTIAHEMVHCIIKKLQVQGYAVFDPMDWMIVNGVKTPYYKNWDPEASDGNFALAFELLSQYWSKIVPLSMPIATIVRDYSTAKETLGILSVVNNGKLFKCQTLELPWFDNKKMISCIPKGIYQVKKVFWPRKLKSFYQVQNVPARSGIFIHEGNYYFNYEGCIGLGEKRIDLNNDGQIDISNTVKTIKDFEKFMEGKPFTLVIK